MDLQSIPSFPQSNTEYDECFHAFLKAVIEGNEELINSIISKEGILDRHFTEKRDTLLHVVAQRGSVETAAKMCKLGQEIGVCNEYGETPLFHAIKHSTEMVKFLINNKSCLKVGCNLYSKPLQAALLSGTENTVQIIINKTYADKHESNFLHFLSVENSEETIEALFNHTKDLLLEDEDYPLVIFFAAKIGNLKVFKLALDGCRQYLDSLDHELLGEILPSKELDFDGFVGRTALHYAVWQQDSEVVRFLLKEGANVNCTTLSDYTPLHSAVHLENEEICKILLCSGAQIKGVQDGFAGVSPLYLACGSSKSLNPFDDYNRTRIFSDPYFKPKPIFNLGIIKLLLQHGVDPDSINVDDGMTPLLAACKAGRWEAVKLLLEFGADISNCDYNKNSTLHYASRADNYKIVDLLLGIGFDIDLKNVNGNTPLLFCLYDRDETCVEMIEYLADFGANITAINYRGTRCLRIASHCDFPDNIECLLELGAKFEMNFILRDYIFELNTSRKTVFAFFVLKENYILGDMIRNYDISEIRQFCETCTLEIEQLKRTKILRNGRLSFYDFLSRDIYTALQMIRNVEVRRVFACEGYIYQFPCYAYLLEKRFERLELLEKTIDDVVEFLHGYKEFNLPILIVDMILSLLSSSDFRNFGRALSSKQA